MLTQQQLSEYSSNLPPSGLNGYLLVDIGGGTVDISAYRIGQAPTFAIDLLYQPKGGPFGGAQVNQEFKKFLAELVDDPGFTRYLDETDKVKFAKHHAHLTEVVNVIFEKQKKIFGDKGGKSETSKRFAVRLPHTFFIEYQSVLERKLEGRSTNREPDATPPEVERMEQTLRFSYARMEKFFEPVVVGIQDCIQEVLEEVDDIDTVYMVGGFGGCRYIIQTLQKILGTGYTYVVPIEPDLAVISGAVLFRRNPAHVHSRRADATYGLRVSIPFIAEKHEPTYKIVSEDDGQELCENVFCTVTERGDLIRTDEVFSTIQATSAQDQRRMHVDIYSSLEKDVWYTTGLRPATDSVDSQAEIRKVDIRKVGELVVPLPYMGTAERGSQDSGDRGREVKLFFDFSHAELQVKGYDQASGSEVTGVIDYMAVEQ